MTSPDPNPERVFDPDVDHIVATSWTFDSGYGAADPDAPWSVFIVAHISTGDVVAVEDPFLNPDVGRSAQ